MTESTIHTSDQGLNAGYDHYEVSGTQVPFYYAAPSGKTGLPVVLVVQEIFGLHEYIADVCRRFAHRGYLAIAPDLYVRQGDASSYTDIPKLMAEIVTRVPHQQIVSDLDGALAWAVANGGDAGRAAITGFCWGGRITWLYCAENPSVKAGVAWYGRLVGQSTELQPRHPVDIAADLKAPVLGLYGAQDSGIPVSTVEEMQQALAAAASGGNTAAAASQIHLYPEAPHAFHADYRPGYRAADAADGFERTLRWFASHGVA